MTHMKHLELAEKGTLFLRSVRTDLQFLRGNGKEEVGVVFDSLNLPTSYMGKILGVADTLIQGPWADTMFRLRDAFYTGTEPDGLDRLVATYALEARCHLEAMACMSLEVPLLQSLEEVDESLRSTGVGLFFLPEEGYRVATRNGVLPRHSLWATWRERLLQTALGTPFFAES